MKVTNNAIPQTSLTPPQQTTSAGAIAREAPLDEGAKPNDGYTPSAEWLRLVDLVKQEPAVRQDRVREVVERLQNGDYLSPEVAAKTADAIMHSLD